MAAVPAKTYDVLLRKPSTVIGIVVAATVVAAGLAFALWSWIQPLLEDQFWFSLIMMAVSLFMILNAVAVCILAERKIAGFIQDRYGPNRVGYWGVFQPVADGLKFFIKEDITPNNADRPIFMLAPCLAMVVALLGFAVIPWAGEIHWPWMPQGETVTTQVASLNIGVLYMFAVAGLGVYGVVLAGWASNNKFAFFGGMRATAQMLSYEVPLGLGLLAVLLVCGTLRLETIVDQQAASGMWNVFLHPIAFLLMLSSGFAETNRAPFDLAECEQELVGGFHTEYSSMKFAMFFLGEYAHMITGSALLVALFFGGWHVWFLPNVDDTAWWAAGLKFLVFWVKIGLFIGFFMVIRWTLPRFRFDQLMRLAWRAMVPIGMALVVATGVLVALGWERELWASLPMNLVILGIVLLMASRSKQKVTGRQANLPEIEVRPA